MSERRGKIILIRRMDGLWQSEALLVSRSGTSAADCLLRLAEALEAKAGRSSKPETAAELVVTVAGRAREWASEVD